MLLVVAGGGEEAGKAQLLLLWGWIRIKGRCCCNYTDANFKSYNIRQQHTVQQQRTTAATYNNNIQQNQCITTVYNNSNGQQHTTTATTYKRIELERFFSFNRINTLTFEDVKLKVCNHVNSYEKDYIGGYVFIATCCCSRGPWFECARSITVTLRCSRVHCLILHKISEKREKKNPKINQDV